MLHMILFRWNSGAGHYTQVVWADTEELGCGMVHYKVSLREEESEEALIVDIN